MLRSMAPYSRLHCINFSVGNRLFSGRERKTFDKLPLLSLDGIIGDSIPSDNLVNIWDTFLIQITYLRRQAIR